MNIPSVSAETLRQRVRFERLVTDISTGFINVSMEEFDGAILRALRCIVEELAVERSTLTQYFPETGEFTATHSWVVDGLLPVPRMVANPYWPWTESRIRRGELVVFSRLEDLPKTKSHLSVPLIVGVTVVGALSLGVMTAERRWPDALVPRVRLLGEVFANALARQQADQRLRAAQSEVAHYQERLAHLIRVHTVGEMSAAIAHEVNQPLMAVKNYALAALRRYRDGSAPSEKQQDLPCP